MEIHTDRAYTRPDGSQARFAHPPFFRTRNEHSPGLHKSRALFSFQRARHVCASSGRKRRTGNLASDRNEVKLLFRWATSLRSVGNIGAPQGSVNLTPSNRVSASQRMQLQRFTRSVRQRARRRLPFIAWSTAAPRAPRSRLEPAGTAPFSVPSYSARPSETRPDSSCARISSARMALLGNDPRARSVHRASSSPSTDSYSVRFCPRARAPCLTRSGRCRALHRDESPRSANRLTPRPTRP